MPKAGIIGKTMEVKKLHFKAEKVTKLSMEAAREKLIAEIKEEQIEFDQSNSIDIEPSKAQEETKVNETIGDNDDSQDAV